MFESLFVRDTQYSGNGISNAFIITLPHILHKAIYQIVKNVNDNYYGSSCLSPTGPYEY